MSALIGMSQTSLVTAAASNGTELVADLSKEADYYLIPDSDSRYLTKNDIAGKSNNFIQMAINEIYAREGRKFNTPEIQEYFNGKDWYEGTIEAAAFLDSSLNEFEQANIAILSHYLEYESEETITQNQNRIDQYKIDNVVSDYIKVSEFSNEEDLSQYIGQKICYQGRLTANVNECLIISDGYKGDTKVTAIYNPDELKNPPQNDTLRDTFPLVKIWGIVTGYDSINGLSMVLDYICISEEFDTAFVDCPTGYEGMLAQMQRNNILDGTEVGFAGVLRDNSLWSEFSWCMSSHEIAEELFDGHGDETLYLQSFMPDSANDYVDVTFDSASFLLPVYVSATTDTFANTPVILYGTYMQELSIFCVDFVEPLPEENWSEGIRALMDYTQSVMDAKAQIANDFINEYSVLLEDLE